MEKNIKAIGFMILILLILASAIPSLRSNFRKYIATESKLSLVQNKEKQECALDFVMSDVGNIDLLLAAVGLEGRGFYNKVDQRIEETLIACDIKLVYTK